MANNIFAGRATLLIAKQTLSFVAMGFTALNCTIIYEVDNTIRSWIPDGGIYPISGTVAGRGYWVWALADMDKSQYFILPEDAALYGSLGQEPLAEQSVGPTVYAYFKMDKVINPHQHIVTHDLTIAMNAEGAWPNAVAVISLYGTAAHIISFASNMQPLPGSASPAIGVGFCTHITIYRILDTTTNTYVNKYFCKNIYASIPNPGPFGIITPQAPSTIALTFSGERNVTVPIYPADWSIVGPNTIASLSQGQYGLGGQNLNINLATPALTGQVYTVTYLSTQKRIRGFNGRPLSAFFNLPVLNLL